MGIHKPSASPYPRSHCHPSPKALRCECSGLLAACACVSLGARLHTDARTRKKVVRERSRRRGTRTLPAEIAMAVFGREAHSLTTCPGRTTRRPSRRTHVPAAIGGISILERVKFEKRAGELGAPYIQAGRGTRAS